MEKSSKFKVLVKSYCSSLLTGSIALLLGIAVIASLHASVVVALALLATGLLLYIITRS